METQLIAGSLHQAILTPEDLPRLNFSHIRKLTDDTGIIQHAKFGIPNRKEGYCIDDNSRALLVAVWACRNKKNHTALNLLPVYLSFIHYMQTDTGEFRNFMTYTKACPEEKGSEDSFGRTMMALGYLVNESSSDLLIKPAEEIFLKALPNIDHLVSLRGIANSMIGICQFIKYNHPDDLKKEMVIRLAGKMIRLYKENKRNNWHWFEPILTYDNGMIPLALLHAYEITKDDQYFSIAKESMRFLESKVFYNNMLRPIGNQGWLKCGGEAAMFDQQGIDAMAMVLLYDQAFKVTGERKYLNKMYSSYQWFLGANDLSVSLYDPSTGGCADGLSCYGINLNQGAESTLAYWISHMAVASVLTA